MRNPRRFLLCLLALSLVIAQFGAQAHAYSHLGDARGASGARGAGGDPQRTHALLCSDCLSFAPLLATADGNATPLLHLPSRTPDLIAAAALLPPRACTLTAYRSRAPPSAP
jgi:hypothetical protein